MTKQEKLLAVFAASAQLGGGVHTPTELAYLLNEKPSPAFNAFLANAAKKGTLRRVARGVYESTITPPDPSTAIYKIIKKLKPKALTYVSLESQLSHTGRISQVIMDRVTLMTTGRKGTFSTPYGTLEFIHTKRSREDIIGRLYFDDGINVFRAEESLAIADLKSCNRNLHMLEN